MPLNSGVSPHMMLSGNQRDTLRGFVAFASILAVAFLANLFTSAGSRAGLVPWLAFTAIGLALAGAVLGSMGWSNRPLIGGLVPIEAGILWLIIHFSGGSLADTTNVQTFLFVNLFIGAPWLLGVWLGRVLLRRELRQSRAG